MKQYTKNVMSSLDRTKENRILKVTFVTTAVTAHEKTRL